MEGLVSLMEVLSTFLSVMDLSLIHILTCRPSYACRCVGAGRLVQPFATGITLGAYWLTRLKSRPPTPAMADFRAWLLATHAADGAMQEAVG